MRIRPLVDTDLAQGPTWLTRADPMTDQWRDSSTRAVAAVEGGALVGFGQFWPPRAHPGRLHCQVVVDPDRRRRGIGTALVRELHRRRPDPRPLAGRAYEDSPAAVFADHLGASAYQICPPERVATADFTRLPTGGSTVDGTRVDRDEIRAAWVDLYAWQHADWSPVAGDFAEAVLSGFDEDLDLGHSRFAVDAAGTIRAAAFVYGDTDPPTVCAESRTRNEPDGHALVRACIRGALAGLAADGHPVIEFDGHVSDPHFAPALGLLRPTGTRLLLLGLLAS